MYAFAAASQLPRSSSPNFLGKAKLLRFVTGHDFSRAATAPKSTRGFSPCGLLLTRKISNFEFSPADLNPELRSSINTGHL
jgi:hypothetical protein